LKDKENDESIKVKEKTIYELANHYVTQNNADKICDLLKTIGGFSRNYPRAKISKMIKVLLNLLNKIPETIDIQIGMCKWLLEWSTGENKIIFLMNYLEIKLASLYLKK
jgi:26S proteasome regulatory subunit N6